jgi:hypothetical protein
LRPLRAAFVSGIRRALNEPGELAVRILFFAVILIVFSALWQAAVDAAGGPIEGYGYVALIWYVVAAEGAVIATKPRMIEDIGTDIASGAIAVEVLRPVSVVLFRIVVFVEKFQMLMVGVLILFMIGAIVIATDAASWGSTVTDAGFLGPIRELDNAALLLGAIAFAGMGGAGNLVQSNWIRDKGLGMGGHMPRVVSPLTGEEVSIPTTGYMFRQNESNMRRWRGWWRVANHEQFWIFFAVGLLSIIVMSVLTVSTVGVGENLGEDLDFIRAEGEALRNIIGPGFGVVFWIAGTVFLLSTNLGILDYCGRLIADVAKVNWFRNSEFWSESKIYFAVIWAMILSGATILMSGMNEPVTLLTIASASGGVVMFVYSALLILLNRKALPDAIKVRGLRLGALVWAVLFYGAASTYLIVNVVIPELTG